MNNNRIITKDARKLWLKFFLCSILTPLFIQILINFHVSEIITKPLGIVDELFVILLFCYSLFVYKTIKFESFEFVLVVFLIIGFLACYINGVPLLISFLGAFNIIKGMLIYICFRNIQFTLKEIVYVLKILCSLLPVIVISDLFDIIWPDFRSYIGYDANQVPEERLGITSVYGFFAPTSISFLCNTIYVIYLVYFRKSKIPRYISSLLLFLTLKVKDTFAFVMVLFFSTAKRIKAVYLLGGAVLFTFLIILYSVYLPDHFEHYFQDEKEGSNARTVTVFTCALIIHDYFPLGVGFGRFASSTAEQFESPVYAQYGIDKVNGLDYEGNSEFINDSFWPMILGETGALGFVVYLYLLYLCFYPYLRNYFKNTHNHRYAFVSLVFIFALVCSLAKATLNGPPDSHLIWGFAGIYYQLAFIQNKKSLIVKK